MPRLEKKEIKEVFDSISNEFSQTRHHPWPEVVNFIEKSEGHVDVALDIGCGNGRHMKELAKKSFDDVIGIDFSRRMLQKAKKELMLSKYSLKKFSLIQGDITEIPLEKEVADILVCIATLHHLPTEEERLKCLNEIYRVLKKGKECLISVWSIKHEKFDGKREKIRKNNYNYLINWKSNQKAKKKVLSCFH